MTRIREEVSIQAPAEEVWNAVHVDLRNVPRWAGYLRQAESLRGRPGPGWEVRYDLELPGGFRTSLTLLHEVWNPFRRCAGIFSGGPLQGDWAYSYEESDGRTHLSYDMDYRLGGLMRFAGAMLKNQYAEGVREGMARLKRYLESGEGGG
jgi:uncharacterized membrane protein